MSRAGALAVISVIAVIGSAMATPPLTAAAQAQSTVQSLYRECKPEFVSGPKFFCLGYVAGIGDAMQANGLLPHHPGTDQVSLWQNATRFCPVGIVTTGAMVQAFVNWAEKHPENWSDNKLFGVAAALRETWPCR